MYSFLEGIKSIVILTILTCALIFTFNDLSKNEAIDKKIIENTENVYKYNNCRNFYVWSWRIMIYYFLRWYMLNLTKTVK